MCLLQTRGPSHTWGGAEVSAAKSLQSCPALCDPIDGSPPGSPVPGILQARTVEWVAISFSTVSRVIINDDYEPLLDPVMSCGESSQN